MTPETADQKLWQEILRVLAFFDVLDQPQTITEIRQELGESVDSEKLSELISSCVLIEKCQQFYFLKGRKEIVLMRKKRSFWVSRAWRRVNFLKKFLSLLPWIKMIAVCNNLAFGSYDEKSDIDLFIICEQKRLFLGRLAITLFFHVLGLRRHGNKIAGRFCLSFFVSEEGMDIGKIRISEPDIYLAYWCKKLIPIYNRDQTFENFMSKNQYWLKKFFPFYNFSKLPTVAADKTGSTFRDFCEKLLGNWQKKRADSKRQKLNDDTGTVISDTMLKFHDLDRRQIYRKQYLENLEKLEIS